MKFIALTFSMTYNFTRFTGFIEVILNCCQNCCQIAVSQSGLQRRRHFLLSPEGELCLLLDHAADRSAVIERTDPIRCCSAASCRHGRNVSELDVFLGNHEEFPRVRLRLLWVGCFATRSRPSQFYPALYMGPGAALAINAGWRIACQISTPWHALGAHGAVIIATVILRAAIGRF